jgi:hypothetical protein
MTTRIRCPSLSQLPSQCLSCRCLFLSRLPEHCLSHLDPYSPPGRVALASTRRRTARALARPPFRRCFPLPLLSPRFLPCSSLSLLDVAPTCTPSPTPRPSCDQRVPLSLSALFNPLDPFPIHLPLPLFSHAHWFYPLTPSNFLVPLRRPPLSYWSDPFTTKTLFASLPRPKIFWLSHWSGLAVSLVFSPLPLLRLAPRLSTLRHRDSKPPAIPFLEKRRSTPIRALCGRTRVRTGGAMWSLEEGAVDKLLIGELGG